ncbi:MAG: crossover junction endodeoxyribonuclease RuvC [Armatimonadia bacterium]|nr:crossover junction endodeoxyribonuclease RuvC [Armatimonadia bacterium]
MRVLGIDPGLVCTGYGGVERTGRSAQIIEAGTIRPPSGADLELRLRALHSDVSQVLAEIQPEATVVEEIYSKYEHPRTAILMGHARGVILLASAQHDIPVVSYAASRIKKSLTGSGRASKEQVQYMITRLLDLPEPPSPADVSDALALAVCHLSLAAPGLPLA